MLRTKLVLLFCMVSVASCGREVTDVSKAAEGARVNTEQMVDRAEAASNARQAAIFAEAAQMQRADNTQRDGPRYEARKDGAGDNWLIYDTRTGQPAKVGTQSQTGLTRAQAAANMSHMQDDDGGVTFRR